jgi:hypothetical protein
MFPSVVESFDASNDRETLHLSGVFDQHSKQFLRDACTKAREAAPEVHLVVDLTAVEFIDFDGLFEVAALVRARRRLGDPSYARVASPVCWGLLEMAELCDVARLVPQGYAGHATRLKRGRRRSRARPSSAR